MRGELLNLVRQQHAFDDCRSIQDKSADQTHCWPFNLLTFPVDVSSMSHQISLQNSPIRPFMWLWLIQKTRLVKSRRCSSSRSWLWCWRLFLHMKILRIRERQQFCGVLKMLKIHYFSENNQSFFHLNYFFNRLAYSIPQNNKKTEKWERKLAAKENTKPLLSTHPIADRRSACSLETIYGIQMLVYRSQLNSSQLI